MRNAWFLALLCATGCSKKQLADVVTLNALTADTHTPFPIAPAAAHAGVDCNSCHGGFDTFTQFSCTSGCHAQSECDPGHSGLADYRYDSNACLACHPNGSAIVDLASHPFPIDATAVHTNIACKSCHTGSSYREYSCTGACHTQPTTDTNHSGVSNYAYASASCLECHPRGIADAAVAHPKFPIGDGTKHAGMGCTQCHVDRAKASDPSQYKCATCHAARDSTLVARHTTTTSNPGVHVKGSELSLTDSRTCLRCHPAAKVDLTKDHPTGPTHRPCADAGSPPHHNAGCTDCHSGYRATPSYAAEFSGSTPPGCAQCHENGQVCP